MRSIDSTTFNQELFDNNFSEWLCEKSKNTFTEINGYEILNLFLSEQYELESLSIIDYRKFIIEHRQLIKLIKDWLTTFELSIEDYYTLFKYYLNDVVLNINQKEKHYFSIIVKSFNEDIIYKDYSIDKQIINLNVLKEIFETELTLFINKSQNNLIKVKEERNRKLLEKKESQRNRTLLEKEERNRTLLEKEERNRKLLEKKESQRLKGPILMDIETLKKIDKINREKTVNIDKLYNNNNLSESELRENVSKLNKQAERKRYKVKRFKNDINFRILHRLRARILLVLKGKKKLESSLNLLGCSPEYLKQHLELSFKDGMSWDNYGIRGWHIDHIRPCASFDLSSLEQQKECFHYSNLQALWWYENLEKSDKYLP